MILNQEKWDRRFLALAEHIAQWSKDPSTKVGAVVAVGKDVHGFGYNGFPRGIDDTEKRYNNRNLKYKLVVHAEVNAILMAGEKAIGATLYVWPSFALPPICNECCKIAIQAGIWHIVGYIDESPDLNGRKARWAKSIKLSKKMCDEAEIQYRGIKIIGNE